LFISIVISDGYFLAMNLNPVLMLSVFFESGKNFPVLWKGATKNPTISGRVHISTIHLDTLGIIHDCKEKESLTLIGIADLNLILSKPASYRTPTATD
jgi:hypothetical protein